MRLKKSGEEKQEREERREALTRAMHSTQDNAGSLDLFGDYPDRNSVAPCSELEPEVRPSSMRLDVGVSKQGSDQTVLRKEVARLEAALVELTQENATQREQVRWLLEF